MNIVPKWTLPTLSGLFGFQYTGCPKKGVEFKFEYLLTYVVQNTKL